MSPVLKAGTQGKETTFIAVSNILTWARLRVDLEEPCTIADEPRRRPHPQYGDLLEAERRITRAQKQGLLRTYVVWPGVQYGGGEGALESVFQVYDVSVQKFEPDALIRGLFRVQQRKVHM